MNKSLLILKAASSAEQTDKPVPGLDNHINDLGEYTLLFRLRFVYLFVLKHVDRQVYKINKLSEVIGAVGIGLVHVLERNSDRLVDARQ
jgi:hypothetical protein